MRPNLSQSPSDYGFDGYQNSINLNREYYQDFACEFGLLYYPFDTQVCHMVFALQVSLNHQFLSQRLPFRASQRSSFS